jgi:glycosidase
MSDDHIFGDLINLDQRIAQHQTDTVGVKHLHRLEPRKPQPDQTFAVLLSTCGPQPYDAARCWYNVEAPPNAEGVAEGGEIELTLTKTAWSDVNWSYIQLWTGAIPAQTAGTMVRYRLAAHLTGSNTWVYADNQALTPETATEFAIWVDENGVPTWARSAVVYHIFLDRFYPGDGKNWLPAKSISDFYGGTLRGVIQKLDYIQKLGFNTLWLSPFFPADSHHGYNGRDYYDVEPRLGTKADLNELIDAAHARGMRLIMDFVANHWSSDHPTFQDAQRNPDSPYRDWYTWIKWPNEYEAYFGARDLPKLNLGKRGPARDYLLECAQYWLKQGFDGFRLDFAYGPSHDFWADFRRACRMVKSDAWIFVEVIHHAQFQITYSGRADGALDFLLARALRETFGGGNWSVAELEAFLAAHEAYFPSSFIRPAFLDNHDMNRFLFLSGDDPARLKLGALMLFTLSEPPIIYNGTESGVTQERPIHQSGFSLFEEARQPMKWGAEANADLLAYFEALIALRHQHRVLREGARRVVHLDAAAGTYAYVRETPSERVLVAFNLSAAACALTVRLADVPAEARDLLNHNSVDVSETTVTLKLPPKGGAFVA